VAQYVLRSHQSEPRQEDLDRIANAPGVKILDSTQNRAMLLEASEGAAAELNDQLDEWTLAKQVTYPQPGPTRQRLANDES
jgi:hypothetical protein